MRSQTRERLREEKELLAMLTVRKKKVAGIFPRWCRQEKRRAGDAID
jgi:hypothetical protein